MPTNVDALAEASRRRWDAIIVGTGMGGATLGYALAKARKSVLFCEKGRSSRSTSSLKGCYAEEHLAALPKSPDVSPSAAFRNAGREWTEIDDRTGRRVKSSVPFIGAGTGGSSALYGMTLERLFPEDFAPGNCFPDAGGSTLPARWPIDYAELAPYYEQAERLFRVRGSPDVLRGGDFRPPYLDPPPLSPGASELFHFLGKSGCHPYRLPMACEYVQDCNGCQGYLCPRECKNDGARICLEPALKEHGASLLEDCAVLRLEAGAREVTGVVCRSQEQTFTLRGSVVVLAAGALFTPEILLRSS
ncbi:MAG: GMC family oxidoreductase N-terminal domain-containing protein [Oligoflexia bacterium]|nr:GMC family oxidoreductase N-terminal domain-containing protein [Oligoflexia bacterium]